MYHILPPFVPTNVTQLFNIEIILNQYIIIIELLIYNEIKRNRWSAIAKPFKLKMRIQQIQDKSNNKSESKDNESVKILNSDHFIRKVLSKFIIYNQIVISFSEEIIHIIFFRKDILN